MVILGTSPKAMKKKYCVIFVTKDEDIYVQYYMHSSLNSLPVKLFSEQSVVEKMAVEADLTACDIINEVGGDMGSDITDTVVASPAIGLVRVTPMVTPTVAITKITVKTDKEGQVQLHKEAMRREGADNVCEVKGMQFS
nr:PREDICTED: uncharacterized protein LOC106706198 [Latimeria chalumnae]|eukprot:XP_014352251.1 PREDICTED: uncharacterized protein LOC106706198 [Latimeria chalumnae]